ncbi:zc3h12a-like ribonuclease NYN domain-containing protein [Phthorimaea operculella]|nr:zc3h12a-like ribonuclease NYN domain-containing protein [Phthorimaea operculella]
MDPTTTSSSAATSSSNQLTAVEKLNGSLNYSSWSFTMKNLLIVSDLWDVVDQPEEKLTELGEQAFKRLDAKAKARICLNLEKHVFPIVVNAETSSETWENLKNNYADSGLLRKLHLLRSLFNSKLEQHQDMQEYVSKIRGIHQQLLEIGEKSIQDSFIGTIMLTGLPESYNPLVMAFENSGVEVTSDSVSAILLKEDQRRTTSTSSAENAAAFHTKPPHCSFCKKFGHVRNECRAKKMKNSKKKSVSSNSNYTSDLTLLSCFSTNLPQNSSTDPWLLDSGCSTHMCHSKQPFSEITPRTHYITVANNEKIASEGKETKGYRLIDPSKPRAVIIARDVVFIENKVTATDEQATTSQQQPTLAINPLDTDCTVDTTSLPEVSDDVSAAPQPQNDLPSEPCESESVDTVDTSIDAEPASPVEEASIPEAATSEPRYPQRERHPPIRYDPCCLFMCLSREIRKQVFIMGKKQKCKKNISNLLNVSNKSNNPKKVAGNMKSNKTKVGANKMSKIQKNIGVAKKAKANKELGTGYHALKKKLTDIFTAIGSKNDMVEWPEIYKEPIMSERDKWMIYKLAIASIKHENKDRNMALIKHASSTFLSLSSQSWDQDLWVILCEYISEMVKDEEQYDKLIEVVLEAAKQEATYVKKRLENLLSLVTENPWWTLFKKVERILVDVFQKCEFYIFFFALSEQQKTRIYDHLSQESNDRTENMRSHLNLLMTHVCWENILQVTKLLKEKRVLLKLLSSESSEELESTATIAADHDIVEYEPQPEYKQEPVDMDIETDEEQGAHKSCSTESVSIKWELNAPIENNQLNDSDKQGISSDIDFSNTPEVKIKTEPGTETIKVEDNIIKDELNEVKNEPDDPEDVKPMNIFDQKLAEIKIEPIKSEAIETDFKTVKQEKIEEDDIQVLTPTRPDIIEGQSKRLVKNPLADQNNMKKTEIGTENFIKLSDDNVKFAVPQEISTDINERNPSTSSSTSTKSSKMKVKMSATKHQNQIKRNQSKTNASVKKLFEKLRNESQVSLDNKSKTSDNVTQYTASMEQETVVVLDDTITPKKRKRKQNNDSPNRIKKYRYFVKSVPSSNSTSFLPGVKISVEDSNVETPKNDEPKKKMPMHCSTPIQNKNTAQSDFIPLVAKTSKSENKKTDNNNKSSKNFNEDVTDLTREINRDSYLTIDLTAESLNCSSISKAQNTVIDLDNTVDNDCTVVSNTVDNDCTVISVDNNDNLSISGESDVTVINMGQKKKERQLNKFIQGIAKLDAAEKGKILELITQNIFNGCKVVDKKKSSLHNEPSKKSTRAPETAEDTYIKEVILGQTSSRNSIGSNIYNPERDSNRTGLRMIVIDGSNVAVEHGRKKVFSVKGLKICIDYFLKRGHVVKAFVPRFRCRQGQSTDPDLLDELEEQGLVVYTPSRQVKGRMITPYDDRYIVQCAAEFDGVIVSGDNYRDLIHENPRWRFIIENRLLMFTWVNDMIMFPKDPLGRRGPSLEEFLRHQPHPPKNQRPNTQNQQPHTYSQPPPQFSQPPPTFSQPPPPNFSQPPPPYSQGTYLYSQHPHASNQFEEPPFPRH